MNLEQIDLTKMPMLKALLTNYVLFNYEDCADTSVECLEMEYYLLKKENRINDLFIQELLDNSWRLLHED